VSFLLKNATYFGQPVETLLYCNMLKFIILLNKKKDLSFWCIVSCGLVHVKSGFYFVFVFIEFYTALHFDFLEQEVPAPFSNSVFETCFLPIGKFPNSLSKSYK